MPDTAPGSLSSVLEGMRSRHYRVDAPGLPGYPLQPGESMCGSDHHRWPCHAHILGGAVAAVLGLADRWDAEVARLDELADRKQDDGERMAVSMRAQAYSDCASELREAFATELLAGSSGKDSSDGR